MSAGEVRDMRAEATEAARLVPFVELLRLYYAGAFCAKRDFDWSTLSAFADEELAQEEAAIAEAARCIAGTDAAAAEGFPYEFNRLFVGPGKLAAAPYETVYVSQGRTLMQRDTLAVRESYRAAGFEPRALNAQPDDHLAFELGFLGLLLDRAAAGDAEALGAFRSFMGEHLGRWHRAHAQEVRESGENELVRAFADLLECVCGRCERL